MAGKRSSRRFPSRHRASDVRRGLRVVFALLRTFLKHVEPGWGETRHLVGILDQITGKDWQPWFERYVYGTETPPVSFD